MRVNGPTPLVRFYSVLIELWKTLINNKKTKTENKAIKYVKITFGTDKIGESPNPQVLRTVCTPMCYCVATFD